MILLDLYVGHGPRRTVEADGGLHVRRVRTGAVLRHVRTPDGGRRRRRVRRSGAPRADPAPRGGDGP